MIRAAHIAVKLPIGLAVLLVLAAAQAPALGNAGQNKTEMIGPAALDSVMAHEQRALRDGANKRIETLTTMRPMPRPRDNVVVSSRSLAGIGTMAPDKLTVGMIDALPATSGDAQWRCLSEAIYFESRGEPLAGQVAVAEVVLNRVESRYYPNDICSVTNQGAKRGRRDCQFSYACDGRSEAMVNRKPRLRAQKLASLMLDGLPRTVTNGATHFHAVYVRPYWARKMTKTAHIGRHVFYKRSTRTASR